MIDRIKQVIMYSQLSSSAFADTIGISRSGMTHLLTGRNQPSLDVARKILAKYPEVSTEWLIMGMGEMLRPDELHPQPDVLESPELSPEPYPAENSKIGAQTDLFGEYALPDDSEEDVPVTKAVTEDTRTLELAGNEEDVPDEEEESGSEPEPDEDVSDVVPTPINAPVQPVRVPVAPVRQRKASAEPRPASAPTRRERHAPAPPQGKKLQKIVFFYDDHSFEVYSN